MKLFLLRHAPAEPGSPDADRPLSPAGHRMAQQLAAFLKGKRYFSFTQVWCSPYRRARETLDPLIAHGLSRTQVQYREDLLPGSDIAEILPEIHRMRKGLLIVGHNPHLATLARYLSGLDSPQAPLSFKKGAVWVFKQEPLAASGFSLAAALPPAALGLKG
ncbi:MAG: phosphohistidine phosphatase SixA [Verrucomicrobia bacterium]|nr:phosphohistidine phosphatase SixA [Verrucomicrobiota bacterium]